MRAIPGSAAMVLMAGLAWIPGAAAAQEFAEESSLSFAVGASVWDGVGVGLAYRSTSLPSRPPAPAAEVFQGVGVGDRYYVDSHAGYDYSGPRCRWYEGDHLYGWIDRYDYAEHRCRRGVSRWGLAISFGFGWHYPAWFSPWYTWHDPFWSPWYTFDPWFGNGGFAFGWRSRGYYPWYSYPVYHGYPAYHGYSSYYYAPRYRHVSGGRLAYGSGYVGGYAPAPAVRYKENPRRTAVARTARVAPRSAAARVSDRSAAASSSAVERGSGVSARPRVVRPEPRTPRTARPRGTGGSTEAVRPGTRTATPRIQSQPRTSQLRSGSDATSVRPRTSPRSSVQPRPSARRAQPRASASPNVRSRPSAPPRVQPRASAPPNIRSRPTPTLRAQPRPSTPRVQPRPGNPRPQPRASAPPSVRSRPAPATRVQSRPGNPRPQPRASARPTARPRPTPAASARPRPAPTSRATARPTRPPRRPPGGP